MTSPITESNAPVSGRSRVRLKLQWNSRDVVAGAAFVGVGLLGLALVIGHRPAFQIWGKPILGILQPPLSMGHGAYLGAGSFPLGLFGLLVVVGAIMAIWAMNGGERLERWHARSSILIMAAVVGFAVTIRPLGLLVAGPTVIVIGSFANSDSRWSEVIVSAIGMTAGSVIVFKYLLKLPIPIAPWLGW